MGPILRAMARQIAYRGPDDEQLYLDGPVGFIFRRLSIVDLGGGAQPMRSEDGNVVTMTNGELYNHMALRQKLDGRHRLTSQSDCEVVAHLYEDLGDDYVAQLNGIFASAIFDKRARRLILTRDRLGVKPLYYYQDSNKLVFASEIKAILAHPEVPRNFDWLSAIKCQSEMWLPERHKLPTTHWQGIHQLPAGHQLIVDLHTGQITLRRYWDPVAISDAPDESLTAEVAVARYRELLADAVKLQLMADVEFGLFLSGGIDSVAVARLAADHATFHTFTVNSLSTIGSGDAPAAHRAAKAFGLPNHQVFFDWRDINVTPEDWRKILWTCETFRTNAEQLYKYNLHAFAKSIRPALKVILLGQGSDEFNGGYTKDFVNDKPSDESCNGDEENWPRLEHVLRDQIRMSTLRAGRCLHNYFDVGLKARCLISDDFIAERIGRPKYNEAWHAYRDNYLYSLQMYQLWHEDRTASAHCIENRVPFLDHRLVELCLRVPPRLYETLFWDKQILRDAMRETLPEFLRTREKVPFFYGEDQRYTFRMMHQLLTADDSALVEQAIAASAAQGGPIAADELRSAMAEMAENPSFDELAKLLEVVNMGLLASMGQDLPQLPHCNDKVVVHELEIADWDSWEAARKHDLAVRGGIDDNQVLRFGDNVLLVRCETGDPDFRDEGGHYILVGTELKYVIEEKLAPWVAFLKLVDGKTSIADLITAAGVKKSDIWKHLEEAVEYQVLVVQ